MHGMGGVNQATASILAAAAIAALGLVGCGGADAAAPRAIADQLALTDTVLRSAIDDWRAVEDPPVRPPRRRFWPSPRNSSRSSGSWAPIPT